MDKKVAQLKVIIGRQALKHRIKDDKLLISLLSKAEELQVCTSCILRLLGHQAWEDYANGYSPSVRSLYESHNTGDRASGEEESAAFPHHEGNVKTAPARCPACLGLMQLLVLGSADIAVIAEMMTPATPVPSAGDVGDSSQASALLVLSEGSTDQNHAEEGRPLPVSEPCLSSCPVEADAKITPAPLASDFQVLNKLRRSVGLPPLLRPAADTATAVEAAVSDLTPAQQSEDGYVPISSLSCLLALSGESVPRADGSGSSGGGVVSSPGLKSRDTVEVPPAVLSTSSFSFSLDVALPSGLAVLDHCLSAWVLTQASQQQSNPNHLRQAQPQKWEEVEQPGQGVGAALAVEPRKGGSEANGDNQKPTPGGAAATDARVLEAAQLLKAAGWGWHSVTPLKTAFRRGLAALIQRHSGGTFAEAGAAVSGSKSGSGSASGPGRTVSLSLRCHHPLARELVRALATDQLQFRAQKNNPRSGQQARGGAGSKRGQDRGGRQSGTDRVPPPVAFAPSADSTVEGSTGDLGVVPALVPAAVATPARPAPSVEEVKGGTEEAPVCKKPRTEGGISIGSDAVMAETDRVSITTSLNEEVTAKAVSSAAIGGGGATNGVEPTPASYSLRNDAESLALNPETGFYSFQADAANETLSINMESNSKDSNGASFVKSTAITTVHNDDNNNNGDRPLAVASSSLPLPSPLPLRKVFSMAEVDAEADAMTYDAIANQLLSGVPRPAVLRVFGWPRMQLGTVDDVSGSSLSKSLDASLTRPSASSSSSSDTPSPSPSSTPAPAPEWRLESRLRLAPVFLAGRYRKLLRGLPQSPWFDIRRGTRIGVPSVQERIEQWILPMYGATTAKMITGGREDADVRMLGDGRPFVLEIQDPCLPHPPAEVLRRVEAAMRASQCGAEVLRLTPCVAGGGRTLDELKEAEELKEKSYSALCWTSEPLTEADARVLVARYGRVVSMQDTPVRVLHRRAPKIRPKHLTIEAASVVPDRPHYVSLRLRTQAGAYVKEFCNGDWGRCAPCLADLLAKVLEARGGRGEAAGSGGATPEEKPGKGEAAAAAEVVHGGQDAVSTPRQDFNEAAAASVRFGTKDHPQPQQQPQPKQEVLEGQAERLQQGGWAEEARGAVPTHGAAEGKEEEGGQALLPPTVGGTAARAAVAPSLPRVEILQLDVLEVHMGEWP